MDKPNCYKCKWKGSVPGSAHICCEHPDSGLKSATPITKLVAIMAEGATPSLTAGVKALSVKGNPRGIAGGWFSFPFNFDPIWLEECSGFTPKEVTNDN